MGAHFLSVDEGGFQELFDSSPDPYVHTSVAAQAGFVLGLAALAASPFSLMHSMVLVVGGLGACLAMVGVITSGRPGVAGRLLAPLGLLLAIGALVVVGLRYAGLDTAVGDAFVPTLLGWLEELNSWFPKPRVVD